MLDGDTKYTAQLRRLLEEVGVQGISTALEAPDMNAVAK